MRKLSKILFLLLGISGAWSCQTLETPKSSKTNTQTTQTGSLIWKFPGPAYEKYNPDTKKLIFFSKSFTEIGDVTISRWDGYNKPLGKWISSEEIDAKKFGDFQSGTIKRSSYKHERDNSKTAIGYEVTFPNCESDNFTIYVIDSEQTGAIKALDYVFHNMIVYYSVCDLPKVTR